MYVILNTIRNSPKDYVGGLSTPWAKEEIMSHWDGNTYQPFMWNEAIARAIRQVVNSEGACGTRGDSHAEYVHDVLKKYYAYDFENLDVMTVTSCNLVDQDDIPNSPMHAIDYLFSMECIDKSILNQDL